MNKLNKTELIEYCKSKPYATYDFPFDEKTMVIRLMGKIFAITDIENEDNYVSLKCNPALAEILREEYNGIKGGYHLNKKHWNTIDTNLDVPTEKVIELIDHSYSVILSSLKKADREKIEQSIKVK